MTLDQRIARLEITNRRYRLLLTAVSLALIAAVCMSAVQIDTVPDVIQTRKLEIVDDLERVLVTLQGGPQGSGVVETFDETGDLVVALSGVHVGNEHHGMVTTYNGNGQELVAVGSGRGGIGVITTFNRNGRKLVRLDANKTGEGMVTTYDRRGRALAALGAAQDDKVDRIIRARGFEVVDDQNRTLVRLRYSAQGSGEVATFDQNGRLAVALSSIRLGDASLGRVTTYNGRGRELVTITAARGGAGVVATHDGHGQKLVRLGATTSGTGAVTTFNGKGRRLVEIGVTTAGAGVFGSYDGEGRKLVRLGPSHDGHGGGIEVLNTSGEAVCTLSVDQDGNGVVSVTDRRGRVTSLPR